MTITEFLLARIAEEEQIASAWPDSAKAGPHPDGGYWMDPSGRAIIQPRDRMLAECEAKRRTVEEVERVRSMIPAYVIGDGDEHDAVIADWMDATVLRFMASVYADHPDYLEEWRP